jgi:hypothetical protein
VGGRASKKIFALRYPVDTCLAGKNKIVPQQKGDVVAALKLSILREGNIMLTQMAHILQLAFSYLRLFVKWFSGMNHYVNAHWGLFIQVALDLLILYIIFMVIYHIVKLSLRILFRIVIPSVILAGVVFFFTSYPFLSVLPIFVCILVAISFIKL